MLMGMRSKRIAKQVLRLMLRRVPRSRQICSSRLFDIYVGTPSLLLPLVFLRLSSPAPAHEYENHGAVLWKQISTASPVSAGLLCSIGEQNIG